MSVASSGHRLTFAIVGILALALGPATAILINRATTEKHDLFDALQDKVGEDQARLLSDEQHARQRNAILWALGIAGLSGIIATIVISRRLLRPAERSRDLAAAIADGLYETAPRTPEPAPYDVLNAHLRRIASDIRVRIERVAQGEKGLRTILAGMVEGVVAIDANRRIMLLNDPAAQMLDIERFVEGESIEAIDEAQIIAGRMEHVLENGRTITEEVELRRAGIKHSVELTIAPLRDADKEITGVVSVMHDLTAVRLAGKMRRDFVANVSHELKTPLTAIHGAASTLVDSPEMPGKMQTKFYSNILRNSERLEQLIGDILELSRIQQGPEKLEAESIDLTRTVSDIIMRLDDAARLQDCHLEYKAPSEPVTFMSDRQAISSIAENLISNAIRYTPAGGKIKVQVTREEATAILSVQDSGIGIEPKYQARIFERFYRVDKARSRTGGGTGLGLAIVKNYVQALEGTIELESTVGEGSTFTVRIPMR